MTDEPNAGRPKQEVVEIVPTTLMRKPWHVSTD
jgi:hypothetical protein